LERLIDRAGDSDTAFLLLYSIAGDFYRDGNITCPVKAAH
jgi:hypothetical protein